MSSFSLAQIWGVTDLTDESLGPEAENAQCVTVGGKVLIEGLRDLKETRRCLVALARRIHSSRGAG